MSGAWRVMHGKPLPERLYAAYDWTNAAGEVGTLATVTGDVLATYCRESAANAAEHGQHDVTESDLLALAEWLALTPHS